jgi:hypothetical protein
LRRFFHTATHTVGANAERRLKRGGGVGPVMKQKRVVGDRDHVFTAFFSDSSLQPLEIVDGARCRKALEQHGTRHIERLAREWYQHA